MGVSINRMAMGVAQQWMIYNGKSHRSKWMMTGGSPKNPWKARNLISAPSGESDGPGRGTPRLPDSVEAVSCPSAVPPGPAVTAGAW